jgi:hypothetical protein
MQIRDNLNRNRLQLEVEEVNLQLKNNRRLRKSNRRFSIRLLRRKAKRRRFPKERTIKE